MSRNIHILSKQTIDQIAAGEVIESPASVVKELVENGIDAGASHIRVETLGGGFQLVKISDDGVGMSSEDGLLCIERHATSKLVAVEDLFSLQTMGFRGEALSSIASISKMTLLTAEERGEPFQLEVEGGVVNRSFPAARGKGTTIEVSSLFYNVPARQKFQKTPSASSAEVTKVMTQLSLAHPTVGFDLIQQYRSIFSLPSSPKESKIEALHYRAKQLIGQEFVDQSIFLEKRGEGVHLWGWIISPEQSRPNRSGQYLFVNSRPIVCHAVSHAVRSGYGTRLGSDRHPIFLLHIQIDPSLVDVNVHPQKKEVRFREESQIKKILHCAVHEAFGQKGEGDLWEIEQIPPIEPVMRSWPGELKEFPFEGRKRKVEEEVEMKIPQILQPIGLFFHYLLIDGPSAFPNVEKEGILFFDLLRIEEVLFSAPLRSKVNKQILPSSQRLIFPVSLSFSTAEAAWLVNQMERVRQFGIQMHQIGENTFLVEEIPSFLHENQLQEFFSELVGKGEKGEDHFAICFARSLQRRKKKYSLEEGVELVKRLLSQDPSPLCCSGGKPIMYYMEMHEIEKLFTKSSPHSFFSNQKAAGASLSEPNGVLSH